MQVNTRKNNKATNDNKELKTRINVPITFNEFDEFKKKEKPSNKNIMSKAKGFNVEKKNKCAGDKTYNNIAIIPASFPARKEAILKRL